MRPAFLATAVCFFATFAAAQLLPHPNRPQALMKCSLAMQPNHFENTARLIEAR